MFRGEVAAVAKQRRTREEKGKPLKVSIENSSSIGSGPCFGLWNIQASCRAACHGVCLSFGGKAWPAIQSARILELIDIIVGYHWWQMDEQAETK
jgi:uncharacterized protein (UPF0276 family)